MLQITQSSFGLKWRERIDWSHTYPMGYAAWNNSFPLSQPVDPERAICQIIGTWGSRWDPVTNLRAKAEISTDGQNLSFSSYGGSNDTSNITYSGSVTVLEFKAKPKSIQKVVTKGLAVTLAIAVDPLRTMIFNACLQTSLNNVGASCYLIDANTINTNHAYDSSYCCIYVVEF